MPACSRIFLVGGYALERECLGSVLDERLGEVTLAGSLRELADSKPEQLAGALIIALGWSEAGPEESLATLRSAFPTIRVVVLINQRATRATVTAALQAGIQGIINESTTVDSLVHLLQAVMAGGEICSIEAARLLGAADRTPGGGSVGSLAELTQRQRDILREVGRGNSNKMIARQFGLSESAVKVHVRAILRKIGAANRTQAAVRAQMLSPDLISSADEDGTPSTISAATAG